MTAKKQILHFEAANIIGTLRTYQALKATTKEIEELKQQYVRIMAEINKPDIVESEIINEYL